MKSSFLKTCLFGLWSCIIPVIVTAADTSKFTIEEAIKNIKPASGMCIADKAMAVESNHSDIGYSESVKPDLSCAILASQLSTIVSNDKNLVLVDTRKKQDFTDYSIAGAMNTSVSDIKNKMFLRDKSVVLIGDGKAERDLYLSCAELKKMAFKDVRVLRGGMPTWLSGGYPVIGKIPQLDQLGVLTSLELWSESQYDENLIVIDHVKKEFQHELNTNNLINSLTLTNLKKTIEKRRSVLSSEYFSSLIIITTTNLANNNLAKLRKDLVPIPTLVYLGTLEEYKLQLSQQKAVLLARDRGPKKPGCHL
ncbi:MAG: rhodanese-like domain-containing protein [Methylomonas lenta]|nr:rhodanese-like domain-containing protein [Methylomonas lenta]